MPVTPPSAPAYVQSLEAAAAKAVAATSISAGWVQWMELADPSSAHRVSVLSYANANPLPVALVDTTGAHLTAVTIIGSATVAGTVTASVSGVVSVTGSVAITPTGSLTVGIVAGSGTTAGALTVSSDGAGPLLRVDVARTSGNGAGDGAITDGADPTLKATVSSGAPGNALHVIVDSTAGGGTTVTGSVVATQGGAPWTVRVTSGGDPIGTVQASVTGHLFATVSLAGVGSVVGSARIQGQAAHDAAWAGDPVAIGGYAFAGDSLAAVASGDVARVLVDLEGRTRVKVDSGHVAAAQTGTWSVHANVGNTVTIVGSVAATPTSSWTVGIVGVPTVVGSVGASQLGDWTMRLNSGAEHVGFVTASVPGHLFATVSVAGHLFSTVSVAGTIAASVSGVVVASVTGQVTVTASLIGQPTVTASIAGIPTVTGSVGASQLGTWSVHANVGNTVTVAGSVFTSTGVPLAGMRAIATTTTSVLAHPFDGAAAQVRSATAAGSVTFYLASDVWTGDLRGLAVLFASSGGAQGVVRTVVSVSNSLVATVDSPWETGRVPHSGQVYKLLVDTRERTLVTFATELSSSTNYVWGTVAQYTVPQSGTATVKPWLDRVRLIDNLATSLEVNQASYWQGAAVTLTVRGAVGCKYIVTSVTGGSFSQWAGAS